MNAFTRMRIFCTQEGTLDLKNNKTIHSVDPVYCVDGSSGIISLDRVLFGHWAALEGKASNRLCEVLLQAVSAVL